MIENRNVWINHPEKGWISAEIIKELNDKFIVKSFEEDYETEIKKEETLEKNPEVQDGIDDMTNLSYLHEAAVVYNLTKRYSVDEIYTYTGSILIAINPYCKLPIYSREMIDRFCNQPTIKLQPHVYSIAENAYRQMLNNQKNQSILVSGESGSGKTESTKFLLQYFAAMAMKSRDVDSSSTTSNDTDGSYSNSIEEQVIKSTPILEAFGNAKTLRNDNSSRFGKFIEIHFDKSRGNIIGARLETYLLEKSRIVNPAQNERSYHIFYQIVNGLPQEILDECHLTSDCNDYKYLQQSGCTEIEQQSDCDIFKSTENALKIIGLNEKHLLGIYKTLAVILHIGNIEFISNDSSTKSQSNDSDNNGETCQIKDVINSTNREYSPFETVCNLLSCNKDQLRETLLYRKMKAASDSYKIPLTLDQCNEAKDSLSMLLYSRLFDWLVKKINETIQRDIHSSKNNHLSIGILDIYGFESFEMNSFEQFSINYANEKLQQQFNQQIFKLEQQEYDREKIDWSYIDFSDNQECIDIIEKKLGILNIIDEESQFPKSTPATLSTKLYNNLDKKSKYFEKPRFSNTAFILNHYAGPVTYNTEQFLIKNKDFIISEQLLVLQESKSEYLIDIFQKMNSKDGNSKNSTFKFVSVSSQFKESLNSLMKLINSTSPHYIRCIKPNSEKKPNVFNQPMVLNQLRFSGVIEQLRISRSGYPSRLLYDDFMKRYKLIASTHFKDTKEWKSLLEDQKKGSQIMLERMKIDPQNFQFGLTKIFLKSGIIAELENSRQATLNNSALTLQKFWKGRQQRKSYLDILNSVGLLQSLGRAILARYELDVLIMEDSCTHLQSLYRRFCSTNHFTTVINSSVHVQSLFRQTLSNQVFKKEMATLLSIIKVQNLWRQKQAKGILRQLKIDSKSLSNVITEKKNLESKIHELSSKLSTDSNNLSNIIKERDSYKESLQNLELEFNDFKLNSESIIQKLNDQIKNFGSLSTINNNNDNSKDLEFQQYRLKSESTITDLNNQISQLKDQYQNDNNSQRASTKEQLHKNDKSNHSQYQLVGDDITTEIKPLRLENQQLKEKNSNTMNEVNQLKLKISQLESQLLINSHNTTNSSQANQHDGANNILPPMNKNNLSGSSASVGVANPNQLGGGSSPTIQDARSRSESHNGVTELISALQFNNNQVDAGKYLVDLMLVKKEYTYIPTGMGDIPEPVFLLTRCFLENIFSGDRQFVKTNQDILMYFFSRFNDVIVSGQNIQSSLICYWFSNLIIFSGILDQYSTNGQTNDNPDLSILYDQLKLTCDSTTNKLYSRLIRDIVDHVQPILYRSLHSAKSNDIEFIDPITNYLSQIQISLSLEKCLVNNSLCKLLFEQLFTFINAMIFNEIILRKDLCCLSSSIPLKMNISELEHWLKSHHGKDWSQSVCDKLKLLKEVVYILMIDKTQLANEDLRREICPTMTTAQLKQLLSVYSPDIDSFEDPISGEILSTLMSSPSFNKSENVLIDVRNIFTLLPTTKLETSINLLEIENTQLDCDQLVSQLMKRNIESSLASSLKLSLNNNTNTITTK
ncbi:myosin-5b [Tieghemostelium lacteum]|uniref:Myosin-5b n=1 Tax=Tieghemostelium lacteum TaxID=361077 RepID=A0A151ZH37_TIELA|nr:myosin-5b [Tieghemostelium lacteum]|eukprot:KYQ93219.1 myosin-5b [Tieghemostelium lacteum]